jgi:NDP-sugar pyrophosphorylase family protein
MQCLILAGGLGTRIKSISGDKPKALLPVGPQTFIDWQLQWLKILGITKVIMAIGHGGEQIVKHITEKSGDERYPLIEFSFDGPKLLGTGGAIRNACVNLESDFIVTYGDTVVFLDVLKMMLAHKASGKPVTLTIFKNANQGDKSNVIFRDGRLIIYDKFNRTPEMDHIDYGMCVLNKLYFLNHTEEGAFDFSHFLTQTSKISLVEPFFAKKLFLEVGSVEGYNEFCAALAKINYNLNEWKKGLQ